MIIQMRHVRQTISRLVALVALVARSDPIVFGRKQLSEADMTAILTEAF